MSDTHFNYSDSDKYYFHYRFDSGLVEDTDENVLRELQKFATEMQEFGRRKAFVRAPLYIDRGVRDFGSGKTFARVFCRMSFDKSHKTTHKCGGDIEMSGFGLIPRKANKRA